jgi:hypothetical protein
MVDWAGIEPATSASFGVYACEGGIHARLNYQPTVLSFEDETIFNSIALARKNILLLV